MLGFPFHWKGLNTCLLDLRQCKTLQFCVFRGCEFLGWKELEFSGIKFGYIAATYTSAIQLTFTKNLQRIRHCSKKPQHTISSILAGGLRRQVLSPPPCRDNWKAAQPVTPHTGGQELGQGSLAPETTSQKCVVWTASKSTQFDKLSLALVRRKKKNPRLSDRYQWWKEPHDRAYFTSHIFR